MIKISNISVMNFENAIRGARNPMNSWAKSDSYYDENGKFVRATTRGNGVVGEDVTSQVLTIKTFPLTIDYKGKIEVQGEAIIRLSVLEEYNKTGDIYFNEINNIPGSLAFYLFNKKGISTSHLVDMCIDEGLKEICHQENKIYSYPENILNDNLFDNYLFFFKIF